MAQFVYRCFLMIGFVLLGASNSFSAENQTVSPLGQALAKQTIDANLPLVEVKNFCRARIAPFPELTTIEEWEKYRDQLRKEVLSKVVLRGEAAKWATEKYSVEFLNTIEGGTEYTIQKLRFEAVPGMWVPAVIYLPKELEGQVPVVLNVNGHEGVDGKMAAYKQIRCINQAKRGMIAMNIEWLGMGQLNTKGFMHYRMNQIDLCGTSGLAPFYLSMKRGLDILLSLDHADPARVAVAGLSGGGWQTIVISSLDERVTLSNPVAGYSSYFTRIDYPSDLGDSEQTPSDLAGTADYLHLTAMRAPRPTLLTNNDKDQCCFAAGHALPPLLEVARPLYQMYGKGDALRSHINIVPGTHNFETDNRQQLYAMFGNFFFLNDANYSAVEIDCQAELKTREELDVPLPTQNADFNVVATRLASSLPIQQPIPTKPVDQENWKAARRKQLAKIVKFKQYDVAATSIERTQVENKNLTYWQLKLGSDWTVPVTEIGDKNSEGITLLISESGGASLEPEVRALLEKNRRVLVVDPFYYGQSKISVRPFLYTLLVASTGERPLGVQASQLVSVSDWAKDKFKETDIELQAKGPRSSLAALIAGALNAKTIETLQLQDELKSLKEIIQHNMSVNQYPEFFCFGLLKHFDIPDLKQLAQ